MPAQAGIQEPLAQSVVLWIPDILLAQNSGMTAVPPPTIKISPSGAGTSAGEHG